MNRKTRRIIDILMTVAILILLAFQVTGKQFHEYTGAVMLILFIAHNALNIRWYKNLFEGRYTLQRMWMMVVNIGLLICMLLQMYSGITMSQYAFAFLPSWSGEATARGIHLAISQWCFLFIGLHLGNHWQMIVGKIMRAVGRRKAGVIVLKAVGYAAAICGLIVFARSGIWKYMFLQQRFFIFDDAESVAMTVGKLICVMTLYVFAGFYIMKWTAAADRKRRWDL